LKVDRATIYRRLKKDISEEELNEALGIGTAKDLPDSMMKGVEGYQRFRQLPKIKEYYETLMYVGRGMSKRKAQARVRMIWRICVYLKKKPDALQPEDVSDLIKKIKKGEAKDFTEGGDYEVRLASRRFLGFMGTAGQKLTTLGIGSEGYARKETRAQAKLTREQRAAVMAQIHKRLGENWKSAPKGKSHSLNFTLRFKDKPELAAAMEIYPKVAFYIGIRASSAFEKSFWEIAETMNERGHRTKFSGVTGLRDFKEGGVITYRHLDKGKGGGIAWTKYIVGDFAKEFHAYWERVGKPETGLVFMGLKDYQVREFLRECYEAAGIPREIWDSSLDGEPMTLHIWRHTGAQELLAATNWNFEVVAKTLGWETIDVMKKHYGSMPLDVQHQLLLKAMGKDIVIEKREFVF